MNMNNCNHEFEFKRFEYERDGMDWWKLEISFCHNCGQVKRKIVKRECGSIPPAWFNGCGAIPPAWFNG